METVREVVIKKKIKGQITEINIHLNEIVTTTLVQPPMMHQ